MTKDRRTFLKHVGAAGITGLLAGCTTSDSGGDGGDGGGGNQSGDGGSGGDGGDTTTTESDPFNVGMVYALGGLGDKSFNDMAHQGIQAAADEYDIQFKNSEPSGPSDFKTLQRRFAQSTDPTYELTCCIGFAQTEALQANAEQFPDQRFMIVDSVVEQDNVANYVFQEHKGSFQVGHLAGLLTTESFSAGGGQTNGETVVGFVGGQEIPLIKKFEAGYKAGANHANGDVDVRSAYVGGWSDPATGKEIALSMMDEGADVIYHAAGGSGIGVFRAAQQRGRYAIGVDSDQSRSAPEFKDVILASMVKHVDTAVQTSVGNVVEGSFNGGSVVSLGLERNGVEAVLGQQLGSEIPDSITSALESSKQAIVDGEIEVPTEPSS